MFLSIDGHQYSRNPAPKGAPSRARGAALHTIFSKKELRARVQEGPVRAVALPPSPTAAALAQLRARAFTPMPLALPRPFASAWLRPRTGRSHGAARRVAPRSSIPARLPHPRKACRAPSPASSPTPRDRLQHAAPQHPFMFACPRFLATGSPLPHAARFPLHVRALAISGQQSEFWHESAPFRRRIGPADSADLGFRRGGAPSSGEGARSACQNSVSWPENACFPARRAGGVRRSRRGRRLRSPRGRVEEARAPAAARGRRGPAVDARGGTEKPMSSPSRPKSLGDTSSLLQASVSAA